MYRIVDLVEKCIVDLGQCRVDAIHKIISLLEGEDVGEHRNLLRFAGTAVGVTWVENPIAMLSPTTVSKNVRVAEEKPFPALLDYRCKRTGLRAIANAVTALYRMPAPIDLRLDLADLLDVSEDCRAICDAHDRRYQLTCLDLGFRHLLLDVEG